MWCAISECVGLFFSVMLTAIAVKLADDFLDRDLDHVTKTFNLAEYLGDGSLLYAMLLLAFAAGIYPQVSPALFLSSYIAGMFSALRDRFPLGLNGYQELVLTLLGGLWVFGVPLMGFALLFIAAVQLIDDCLDARQDQAAGNRNLACRFGLMECCLAALLCLLLAWQIKAEIFVPVLSATIVVYGGLFWFTREKGVC